MLIKQSESTAGRRTVYFTAVNTADDSVYTSTLSGADIRISKAGGAEADSAGVATHIATGMFSYELTAGEVDTIGEVAIRLAKTGVYNDVRVVNVVGFDPATAWPTTTEITTDVLDSVSSIETSVSLRAALRMMLAVLAGRVTGAGTGTEVFRAAVSDTEARVTVSVDANGNRTSITYDYT